MQNMGEVIPIIWVDGKPYATRKEAAAAADRTESRLSELVMAGVRHHVFSNNKEIKFPKSFFNNPTT